MAAEELVRVWERTAVPTKEFDLGKPVAADEVPLEPLADADDMHAVEALRLRVADVAAPPYWHTSGAYLRFVVARKRNLDAAEEMFRAAMRWRAESGADELLSTYRPPPVLQRFFPVNLIGADRDGHPLLVERIGAADLAGLGRCVGPKAFLRWVAWYHERQEAVLRRATELAASGVEATVDDETDKEKASGDETDASSSSSSSSSSASSSSAAAAAAGGKVRPLRHKMSVIVDLQGIGMRHLGSDTMSVLRRRTALEEANYPEVVRKVFLLRAPAIFAGAWTVVRAFVDAGTRAKMVLMSSGFLPTVEAVVPRSSIPAFLGGDFAPGGDPECVSVLGTGGPVPEGYLVGPDGAAQTLSAPAGGTASLRFALRAGQLLRFAWRSPADETWLLRVEERGGVEVWPPAAGLEDSYCFATAAALGEGWEPVTMQDEEGAAVVEGEEMTGTAADAGASAALEGSGVGGFFSVSATGEAGEVVVRLQSSAWLSTTKVLTRCTIIEPASE